MLPANNGSRTRGVVHSRAGIPDAARVSGSLFRARDLAVQTETSAAPVGKELGCALEAKKGRRREGEAEQQPSPDVEHLCLSLSLSRDSATAGALAAASQSPSQSALHLHSCSAKQLHLSPRSAGIRCTITRVESRAAKRSPDSWMPCLLTRTALTQSVQGREGEEPLPPPQAAEQRASEQASKQASKQEASRKAGERICFLDA